MKVSASLLILILLSPFVTACGQTVDETFDDATITTRVKIALLADPVVQPQRIDVETFKGVVTLKGRVQNKQQEEKAIALARTIRGDKDVQSTLQIQQ